MVMPTDGEATIFEVAAGAVSKLNTVDGLTFGLVF